MEPVVDAERRLSYWMRWALRQSAPEAEKTFNMFQHVSTCFNMFQKMHRTGCFQQVRAPGAARLSKSHVENTLLNLSDLDLSCKND